MSSRPAARALVAVALVLATSGGTALAQPPAAPAPSAVPAPSAAPAPAPAAPAPAAPAPTVPTAPAAPVPQAQPKGAVVVATSEGAGPAAKALAFEVYRDAELRPEIDDATARVLAGAAPGEGATARLNEIAELRASIVRALAPAAPVAPAAPAAPGTPAPLPATSDLVARRLLASLGTELQATFVISVAMDGSRPVARALRSSTATFERIEFGPTVDIAADGARTYRWPGATSTLRSLLPAPPPAPVTPGLPAALAPKAETALVPGAPAEPRPFYKSPWFWGSVGGAAAIGLSVFLISRATSSTTDVHLMGKVGP